MQYAMLLAQFLPAIFAMVRAVEAAVPQSGQGAHKLNAVLAAVGSVAVNAPAILANGAGVAQAAKLGDLPGMNEALAGAISATVRLLKDTGAFPKAGVVQALTANLPGTEGQPGA